MNVHLFLAFAIGLLFVACGNNKSADNNSPEKDQHIALSPVATDTGKTYVLDEKNSVLNWKGSKKIGKSHFGKVNIKNGEFHFGTNGAFSGGTIVINMQSIQNVDIEDPSERMKLEGHLKSADFFNTEKYPEATFNISSIKEQLDSAKGTNYLATGSLTVKGITKPISFPLDLELQDQGFNATGTIILNRTDWDVRFGSKNSFPDLIGNQVINDEVELSFSVKAELEGSIH
ncbi:MAG: YceI family protein [Chitinophagales bacterium]|nr:YceI family protein [Chitinophagales bacterium]